MEVKLREDFYGTKISKVSSQSILITLGFKYKGPAQTLSIETNTGKKGLWGDYDQESPAYYDSKAVSASEVLQSYTFSRSIPLSFWGDRQIDDCAVEVVIRGEGVYADAVIWDAYTVNVGPPTPPPGKEAPEIQTLPAINILHNSATLITELTKVGFCNVINCYIEWGRTTAYGFKSPERRLYPYPDPRSQLHVDITGLEPGTTYHFRGVAVGRCVTPALTGYGTDMTFTTKTEVVKGFTMRVINAPPPADTWWAGIYLTAIDSGFLGLAEEWRYQEFVPATEVRLVIWCGYGPMESRTTVRMIDFPFLLRDGKRYVYNFDYPGYGPPLMAEE